jgi:hypothetical protein
VIWRRERFDDGARWRVVYEHRYPAWANISIEIGDVTNDGVADVLHYDEQGSGGCGSHYLVATVGESEREIYRRDSCESYYRIRRGALVVDEPVGPCPVTPGSAHCFGGRRVVALRWSGKRIVPVSSETECTWPALDLDPARECRRRPT